MLVRYNKKFFLSFFIQPQPKPISFLHSLALSNIIERFWCFRPARLRNTFQRRITYASRIIFSNNINNRRPNCVWCVAAVRTLHRDRRGRSGTRQRARCSAGKSARWRRCRVVAFLFKPRKLRSTFEIERKCWRRWCLFVLLLKIWLQFGKIERLKWSKVCGVGLFTKISAVYQINATNLSKLCTFLSAVILLILFRHHRYYYFVFFLILNISYSSLLS